MRFIIASLPSMFCSLAQSLVGCLASAKRAKCPRRRGRRNSMKLVTFMRLGQERLGLLAGDTVIDPLLASGDKAIFANALSFIGILRNPVAEAMAGLGRVAAE